MKQSLLRILLLFAAVVLLSTCVKDNFNLDLLSDEMEIEPNIILPILYGSFDMDDLVDVIDSTDYALMDEEEERYYIVFPDTIYSLLKP